MPPTPRTPLPLVLLRLPLVLLALTTLTATASPVAGPQSSMRVSFVSPPHSYSHGVDSPVSRFGRARLGQPAGGAPQRRPPSPPARAPADRGMTLALVAALAPEPTQHPGYFLSRPRQRLPRTFGFVDDGREISNSLRDPEAMWPMGVFLPPDHDLEIVHLSLDPATGQQLFSEPDATPDPFLRTGQDAVQVVKYLLSLGELFFDKYPHAEVLLRHQRERLENGLAGNKLGSIRPDSPFYRWPMTAQHAPRFAF
ncbi:uncharacterized protein LOC124789382 [Schistocerca piceifrons]|uniref:uncharacterized protein LOC124789382 n=1 Tax=Schistocerca piceifrons TaxID=274613 RepID=UPI001F5ECCC1|nr:uncharacterized protein LOC124789382 [Schistocerca piceifrons]